MREDLLSMGWFRRLMLLSLLLVPLAASALDEPVSVEKVRDLQRLTEQARAERLPVLLFFSASGCHYCRLLEEEFLHPMLRNGGYEGKRVLMRRVMIDDSSAMRDFDGAGLEVGELQRRYGVWVTPTMLFVGADGGELVKKIVGITTPELFGGYLDEAIDDSLAKVRAAH